MTTAALWALVAILTVLALAFAIAGFWVEHYLRREQARKLLRDAEQRAERRGSVIEFYRTVDAVKKHKRRWAA